MRRKLQGDPCCVPGCYRRAKSGMWFCERCWGLATDDERAGILVATHAPFYRRSDRFAAEDVAVTEPGYTYEVVERYGYAAVNGLYVGEMLREYETRTTRDALARLLADRRWAANGLAAGAADDAGEADAA